MVRFSSMGTFEQFIRCLNIVTFEFETTKLQMSMEFEEGSLRNTTLKSSVFDLHSGCLQYYLGQKEKTYPETYPKTTKIVCPRSEYSRSQQSASIDPTESLLFHLEAQPGADAL
jgi:hypothetical protein